MEDEGSVVLNYVLYLHYSIRFQYFASYFPLTSQANHNTRRIYNFTKLTMMLLEEF